MFLHANNLTCCSKQLRRQICQMLFYFPQNTMYRSAATRLRMWCATLEGDVHNKQDINDHKTQS